MFANPSLSHHRTPSIKINTGTNKVTDTIATYYAKKEVIIPSETICQKNFKFTGFGKTEIIDDDCELFLDTTILPSLGNSMKPYEVEG